MAVETIVSSTVALIELFNLAKKEGWFDKLKHVFKKKHNILILGLSGTGKTNFLQSLVDLAPIAIDQLNRTEYNVKHKLVINNNPFIFTDTPGQLPHESIRLEAIREAMRSGIDGVINVTSFGYHEYRLGIDKVYNQNGTVKTKFLEQHKSLEIQSLKEWVGLLGDKDTIKWMMTVVTKADLWWQKRAKVIDFYTNGNYHKNLGPVLNLSPHLLEYCSVIHKFYGVSHFSSNFDEADRTKLKYNLIMRLLESIGKESKNA